MHPAAVMMTSDSTTQGENISRTHEAQVNVASELHAIRQLLGHAAHEQQQQGLLHILVAPNLRRQAACQPAVYSSLLPDLLHVSTACEYSLWPIPWQDICMLLLLCANVVVSAEWQHKGTISSAGLNRLVSCLMRDPDIPGLSPARAAGLPPHMRTVARAAQGHAPGSCPAPPASP